jgi:hypothetical protein
LEADFSVFRFFSIFGDGILARRSRPCVVAHRKRVLKPRNWAPEVAGFYDFVQLVDLVIKHKPRLTQMDSGAALSTPPTDPTHRTRSKLPVVLPLGATSRRYSQVFARGLH